MRSRKRDSFARRRSCAVFRSAGCVSFRPFEMRRHVELPRGATLASLERLMLVVASGDSTSGGERHGSTNGSSPLRLKMEGLVVPAGTPLLFVA